MTSNGAELTAARNLYGAFNDPTIDRVMEYFSDSAIYEDPTGGRHVGRAAIAAALSPSFSGTQRYTITDIFSADGAVIASWILELGPRDARQQLDGIDVLRFAGGKVELKQCFMKASGLLMRPVAA